jgi:hypothetical protein
MINLFKKPKVVFDCLIPGVEQIMPMVEAREIKHSWTKKAVAEFLEDRKKPGFGMSSAMYTGRCPGIFSLQRHGWIMRTWQDIVIETFNDPNRIEWATPLDQRNLCPSAGDAVGFHSEVQLKNYMDNWPTNTLNTVIKIQSAWRCTVPKGYYLMEMPVAYSDENRFTTLPGFFNHDQGPAQMNPQLLWHVPLGKTLIKAGTPVAQYILVPTEKHKMEMHACKQSSSHEVFELINTHRFIKNYAEVKRFYGEEK